MQFTVPGIPASSGTKYRRHWQQRVRVAAEGARARGFSSWGNAPDLSVLLVFFHNGPTSLDVDNVAKPILDALNGIGYDDDGQVVELISRKTPLAPTLSVRDAPDELLDRIQTGESFVFVDVRGPVRHGELPP